LASESQSTHATSKSTFVSTRASGNGRTLLAETPPSTLLHLALCGRQSAGKRVGPARFHCAWEKHIAGRITAVDGGTNPVELLGASHVASRIASRSMCDIPALVCPFDYDGSLSDTHVLLTIPPHSSQRAESVTWLCADCLNQFRDDDFIENYYTNIDHVRSWRYELVRWPLSKSMNATI
jgi:hypothetical protein